MRAVLRTLQESSARFADALVPLQGFAGVDYGTKDRSSGPVQFERDPAEAVEADPFGLDQIISEVGRCPLIQCCSRHMCSCELQVAASDTCLGRLGLCHHHTIYK